MQLQANSSTSFFRKFATRVANTVGTSRAFVVAIVFIIAWLATGPIFGFTDTWQLIINTATTIITFLMVFVIQNTQNRDSKAIHIKLDELIKGVHGARNTMMSLEELPDEEIEKFHDEFLKLHDKYQKELDRRKSKK